MQLALTGHDHIYERTHPQSGVTYIVTGAGAKLSAVERGITYADAGVDIDAGNFVSATLWGSPPTPQVAGSAEVLVIDDKSTDRTGEIADRLAADLGLPGFAEDETGTTVAILAPDLGVPHRETIRRPAQTCPVGGR